MNLKYFSDFDFSSFWKDSEYAREEYVADPPSDELMLAVEAELGYKLPESYKEFMKIQNGGIPVNDCFPTTERTSWAEDHVCITGFFSIGREKNYSLCGRTGSSFFISEWEYPNIGIIICDTPSGGHDMIMLDYSKNGPTGEPEVVHIDQEFDYQKTFLAKDFETFVRGLVNESVYDRSEEIKEATPDGEFSAGGYAPDFVEEWFADRLQKSIIVESNKRYRMAEEAISSLIDKVNAFGAERETET